jgi:hypothetical protein
VEALVQRIRRSQDPGVRARAATAIADICRGGSADVVQQAAAAGAVEALVQLISSSQDPAVLMSAARAL